MFATLFLGAVVAVFLTLGVVRGDAETGLLQPLVVRPLGRRTMLLARFAGAAAFAAAYGLTVYLCAMLITGLIGGWWPDHVIGPGLGLAAGLVIVAALSMLASVFLTSTAQGIAILMVFGAGLTAGLLGQIGDAINSNSLSDIAKVATWALPFEALYQGGLHALTSDTGGLTGKAISLGPFGGPQSAGIGLILFALIYLGATLAAACALFAARDL
jgi:Cu-processing system permease protein